VFSIYTISMAKSNKNNREIYLDCASSALRLSPNVGAIHKLGVKEKNKLDNARKQIAEILKAYSNEVIFTSGATESNNLAIQGIVSGCWTPRIQVSNTRKPHIITTNVEHSSVLEVCRHLEQSKQAKVTYVKVEKNGIVDVKKIKKAFKSNTVLVSVMYANNEIGTIQPIREIAKEVRYFKKTNSKKVYFHTDATQATNYLSMNVEQLGVDLMSFNSAKIYGPKGIGVLYVKKNTPIKKIMFGGDQEFGLRPGTENVDLIVKLAETLSETEKIKEKESKRLQKLRDYFIDKIFKKTTNPAIAEYKVILNGDREKRLPNNINITIPEIPSDLLVIELSARGIMASSKSACKSSSKEGSYVIKAIHPEIDFEIGGLRFSLGRETTKGDIDYTVKALTQILKKLKKWYTPTPI